MQRSSIISKSNVGSKYMLSTQLDRVGVNNRTKPVRQDSRPYCLTAPWGSRDIIGHVTI